MQNSYNFDDTKSGIITKTGASYSVSTGSANVKIGKTLLLNKEWRAFMHFDGNLPLNAIIDKVEFLYVDATIQPVTAPSATTLLIGNWIGSTLESTDFTGGNDTFIDILAYGQNTWIDLSDAGVDPTTYISANNKFDIAIRDLTTTPPSYNGGHNFNKGAAQCQLRITWHCPPSKNFININQRIMKKNEV